MRRTCLLISRPCRRRHDLPMLFRGSGSGCCLLYHAQGRQNIAGSALLSRRSFATDRTSNSKSSSRRRNLLTLAIESSCDDTCIAILEKDTRLGHATLHFNEKVTVDSRGFQGIEPITTVESHVSNMAPLLKKALRALPAAAAVAGARQGDNTTGKCAPGQQVVLHDNNNDHDDRIIWIDGRPRRKPDFVSVTRGPGMMSNLTVGLMTAKSLAVAWEVPLLAVNHMEAHALTPRLVHALEQGAQASRASGDGSHPTAMTSVVGDTGASETSSNSASHQQQPEFPFLSVLVSGGHSLLVHSRALNDHAMLAQAHNIAIGDLLDKCARLILPESVLRAATDVMYGRLLEEFAFPSSTMTTTTTTTTTTPTDASACPGQEQLARLYPDYTPPATRADEQQIYTSPKSGWFLRPPMHESAAMVFDFSGINGRVKQIIADDFPADTRPMTVDDRRELARQTMRMAFEHLASRLVMALREIDRQATRDAIRKAKAEAAEAAAAAAVAEEEGEGNPEKIAAAVTAAVAAAKAKAKAKTSPPPPARTINTVVLSGGVASNKFLRHILRSVLDVRGYADVKIVYPPVSLCTDNAAMIAWTGMEMYEAGWRSELGVRPLRKWPLDAAAAASSRSTGGDDDSGGGILGVPGWYSEPPV